MKKRRAAPKARDAGELVIPGHLACPGCGQAMAMRMALKALGPETIVVMPTSCLTFAMGPYPYTSLRTPLLHVPPSTTAQAAAGVRAALDVAGKRGVAVVGWADAGALAAGLAGLAHASGRREDLIFVCCDIRMPVEIAGDDVGEMVLAHGASYFGATTPALPGDFMGKFEKARALAGLRFIHVMAACPRAWGIDPARTVEAMRNAVQGGAFHIREMEGR